MINYTNVEQETRAIADNPSNQPINLKINLLKYFDVVTISSNRPQIPYHLRIMAYDDYGEPQIIVYCGNSKKFGWYYDVQSNEVYMKGVYK